MQRPSVPQSVYKLAIAGEKAGFSVEHMIQMLNAGITVETLLDLIEWRLRDAAPEGRSSRWIMSFAFTPLDTHAAPSIKQSTFLPNGAILFRREG